MSTQLLTTPLSTSPPKPVSQATWVDVMRAQTRSNHFREAISTYVDMTRSGSEPDNFAFPAVLKFGFGSSSTPVANTLVNLYGKCGEIGDAYKVFDEMSERDQVSWNSMIAALCRFEEWDLALEKFREMLLEDNVVPSSFTLVSVALACSNLSEVGLRLGNEVHGYSVRRCEEIQI